MFRSHVKYYEAFGFTVIKLFLGAVLALFVGYLNMSVAFEVLERSDLYDGFILSLLIAGLLSTAFSFFFVDSLYNLVLGSLRYLRHLQLPKEDSKAITFSFETLFDLTIKNTLFYQFVISFGYFAGIFERHSYLTTLGEYSAQKTALLYYFSYVKYPAIAFFVSIVLIASLSLVITLLQKPVVRLLKKNNMGKNISNFMAQWVAQIKNKSLIMACLILLPSIQFTAFLLQLLPESVTLVSLAKGNAFAFFTLYPLLTLFLTVRSTSKAPAIVPDTEEETAKNNANQSITKIAISGFVDPDIRAIIQRINQSVDEVNPYMGLAEIEETHVLKRITQSEVVSLLEHYNKLPEEDRKELKKELLERLHSVKETAAKIADISRIYHYERFKKQSALMGERYNSEKNA